MVDAGPISRDLQYDPAKYKSASGWTMNVWKQGGNRYFKELLQRIRDIRSSERNFYQQVTDIYATSTDYDPRAKLTKLRNAQQLKNAILQN